MMSISFSKKRFIRPQTSHRSWLEIEITFRQDYLEESTSGGGARRSPPASPTVQNIGPAIFAITPSFPDSCHSHQLTCITLSIIFMRIISADNPRSQGDQFVLRSRHGGYLQQSMLEGRAAYLSRADLGRSSEKTRSDKRRRQPGFASIPAGESIGTTERRPKGATQHTNQQPVPGMFRLER